jgi:hypothetical protein
MVKEYTSPEGDHRPYASGFGAAGRWSALARAQSIYNYFWLIKILHINFEEFIEKIKNKKK